MEGIIDISLEEEISVLERHGENLTANEYPVNPALERDDEIGKLVLVLLTPDKSAILVGKPGIGKTAIVEGLAYRIQKNEVPDVLKGYTIIKINTPALIGLEDGTNKVTKLLKELQAKEKIILFIDEIHTLIGNDAQGALDLANMFKPGLDRGAIKVIGATTTDEYERYVLRDRAFVRRFEKVEVSEPDHDTTVKILLGVIKRLEIRTGIRMGYTSFIHEKIANFIVGMTSEYKRVYGISSRYPDIAIAVLSKAFSHALFKNKQEVSIQDVYDAVKTCQSVYPDVVEKELKIFIEEFKDLIMSENVQL